MNKICGNLRFLVSSDKIKSKMKKKNEHPIKNHIKNEKNENIYQLTSCKAANIIATSPLASKIILSKA